MNVLQRLFPLFVVLALIGLGAAGYFYYQFQSTQSKLLQIQTDPSMVKKAAQEETAALIKEVGQLIVLPTGEQPTVATVTDVEKLKGQAFFQKAKNGYKVLIYSSAKKAILYDPAAKKIIDVAPVNIGSSSATVNPVQSQPTVALRNGTKTVGLTTTAENDLKKAYPEIKIVDKDNAVKKDYATTIVVVINETARDYATKLAKTLKSSVESLPAGETKPDNVDIVIFLGKDQL